MYMEQPFRAFLWVLDALATNKVVLYLFLWRAINTVEVLGLFTDRSSVLQSIALH